MRLLLDTNALYWLVTGSSRLGMRARESLLTSTLVVSDISLLELSIKVSVGKLHPLPGLHVALREQGLDRTGVEERFLGRLERLPLIHRDPFDRLLIAQALTDNLPVLTADRRFAEYGVRVINAHE